MFSFLAAITLLLFATSQCQVAFSQSTTRLYIPGLDAQEIVGNIVGVNGGRTTWTLFDEYGSEATLISGSGFATATISSPDGEVTEKACSVSLGFALCATSTGSESAVAVQTALYREVQISSLRPTSIPISRAPALGEPTKTLEATLSSESDPSAQTASSGMRTSIQLSSYIFVAAMTFVLSR